MEDTVVAAYHRPRIGIVVPHYNLSEYLHEALLSVQQQTYHNFACVIVDDCSSPGHASTAARVVQDLRDERFRFIQSPRNKGMVHAIYQGMDEVNSSFICVLDPDDRYTPHFLQRMLDLHLNRFVFCPIACCDQYYHRLGDGIITSTQRTHWSDMLQGDVGQRENELYQKYGFHKFVPPWESGWHWSSTSSMMFRTEALKLFRPLRDLDYKGQGDDYCANGAHMLGGSLLLREPLVYRGLHERNDFVTSQMFSMWQRPQRIGVESKSEIAKHDVVEAFFANNGIALFEPRGIAELILSHFRDQALEDLLAKVPSVREMLVKAGMH